jgi:hypothetical protein
MRLEVIGPFAGACLLVLLSRLPGVPGLVPVLGLLTGPLGVVLLVLTAAIGLLRWRPPKGGVPAIRIAVLFAVSTAFSLALGIPYVRQVQASGDEVEYLLMAQSLWREGDLDLRDNFARGDYLEYVPGLDRLPHGTQRADGRPISTHSVGLPALLAPVYALGGRVACAIFLALLAAWLSLEVWWLAQRASAGRGPGLFAWAACLGPPVVFYSFYVYTEVPSALALALGLRLLLGAPGPARAALAALVVSALPWLHVKMIPAAAVLGIVALVRLRGRPRLAFFAVAAVMAALLLAYYWVVFGRPTPFALYGSRAPKPLERMTPLRALPGLFLDSGFGLLPYAPIFLLALAGLPRLLRRESRDGWVYGLLMVALVAPLLAWRNWWGGFCPPSRFLVPLVPVLAVGLALRLDGEPRGLAHWRWPLLLFGPAFAIFLMRQPSETMLLNNRDDPPRTFQVLAGATSPARYLPQLSSRAGSREPPWKPPVAEQRVAAIWVAALGGLLALDGLARRHSSVDVWFRSFTFPAAGLLLLSLSVDYWARADNPPAGPGQEGADASIGHVALAVPVCAVPSHSALRARPPSDLPGRDPARALVPADLRGPKALVEAVGVGTRPHHLDRCAGEPVGPRSPVGQPPGERAPGGLDSLGVRGDRPAAL